MQLSPHCLDCDSVVEELLCIQGGITCLVIVEIYIHILSPVLPLAAAGGPLLQRGGRIISLVLLAGAMQPYVHKTGRYLQRGKMLSSS